jgi:hypothetical protein
MTSVFLDFSEYDPKNLNSGKRCTIPGKAVLTISAMNYKDGDKGPYFATTFVVVAHEVPEAVGQEYFQILPLTGKGAQQTQKVAMAVGVLTDKMIQEAALGGRGGVQFDLTDCVGKQVCGEITKGEWNNKPTYKIWDFWGVGSKDAADYPKVGAKPAPAAPAAATPPAAAATPPPAETNSVPVVEEKANPADDLPF